MPVRIPVAALVLAVGFTFGLVTVAVISDGRPPTGPSAPFAPSAPPGRPSPAGHRPTALAVLADWDQRRASAWADGDPVALGRLYTAGSSARARDVALLRRYAARGYVVRGLRMQLIGARVLVARPGLIRLEVTDRLEAAVAVPLVARNARDVRLPADGATTRELVLRRVGGRWLMARVSEPAAGSGHR